MKREIIFGDKRRAEGKMAGCQEDKQVNESCHPEFISGSVHCGKWKLPWDKMLKHLTDAGSRDNFQTLNHHTDAGSQGSSLACSLCKVQGDKFGFTLAEVLITIGIIGVVAAITIPSLVTHFKKVEYSTKIKRFYSVMTQAIRMSEAENESSATWQKEGGIHGDIKDDEGNVDYSANSRVIIDYIKKYISPYLKISSLNGCEDSDECFSTNSEAYMIMNDGSYVYLHNGDCIDFVYDVNGPKKPNEIGKDVYGFILCSQEKCENMPHNTCGRFIPLSYSNANPNRNTVLNNCKNNPRNCTYLLYLDNFEYKHDYPYKL